MNPTNPYWQPPPTETKFLKPIVNTLGFQFQIPWPSVTTAGWYYGEGAMPDRRELVYRADPEFYARGGIVPSFGGVPTINPYDPIYRFSRDKFTVRV